jgi:Uma2 family endonuclease
MHTSPPLVSPEVPAGAGEPAWEVATLFPDQGSWSEEEYFRLNGNRLIEYSHGYIDVLPMPPTSHQSIALFLFKLLDAFVAVRGLGKALAAPLRVQLWPGKFREPNVLFRLRANLGRILEQYWQGADLVIEVVSDDYRRHDVAEVFEQGKLPLK